MKFVQNLKFKQILDLEQISNSKTKFEFWKNSNFNKILN
jgi:hypothetical protein